MAAPVMSCFLRAVSTHCPSHIFTRISKHSAVAPTFANLVISNRFYASKKKFIKAKSESGTKNTTAAPKPFSKKKRFKPVLPSKPTDDVYLTWCYQKPIYDAEVAVDMLKKFQQLDFTKPEQYVYADINLDMSMGTKKPLEPFEITLLLPHPFLGDVHKVVVFTENEEEAALAKENGAAFVGGYELVKPIIDGEIQADFYVTVPPMLNKLNSLRTVLKEKHPKSKNGSVGYDVLKMLNFFKACSQYEVETNRLIQAPIAMLDMPSDHIIANLEALIKDVCKHKPFSYGPFVTRLLIQSETSESLDLKFERFLSQESLKGKTEEQAEEEGEESGDEEEMQESKQ